jgi:zinc protease
MSAIAPRIKENTTIKGVRLLSLKTSTPEIVMLKFSFKGGFVFQNDLRVNIPNMLAGLLDKGTKKKSKVVLRKLLAAKGLSVNFSAGSHFADGSFYALKDDLETVLKLGGEMFQMPKLDPKEIELFKKQQIAGALERKQDTDWRAIQALRANIYPKDHYLYLSPVDDTIQAIKSVNRKTLLDFHSSYFGRGTIQAVLAGDVGVREEQAVLAMFRSWKAVTSLDFAHKAVPLPRKATEVSVPIKDKANISVAIGQALSIHRNHPDYYPLLLGVMILGDDFTARLMQEIRDKRGLTYGIYATLSGFEDQADGFFSVRAGFAPSKLREGEQATLTEIKRFVQDGVTEAELTSRKENYLGSFIVGYSTTTGLASDILNDAELGHPKTYIDEFPQIIKAITVRQVNDAIKKHIDPTKLVIARAGSI